MEAGREFQFLGHGDNPFGEWSGPVLFQFNRERMLGIGSVSYPCENLFN